MALYGTNVPPILDPGIPIDIIIIVTYYTYNGSTGFNSRLMWSCKDLTSRPHWNDDYNVVPPSYKLVYNPHQL